MTNMISADNTAVLAANNGAGLAGRTARTKPRRAGAGFRNGMAGGKPEIARRLAAVDNGKMNLRAMAAEPAAGNLAAADNSRAFMANAQAGAVAADSAGDNAQLMAILAGIQQSSRDTAKALAQLANQRGCGCCCCGDGGNNVGGVGCNIVYATYDADKSYESGKIALFSYHQPLASQAEADAVDVLVFLGGSGEGTQEFGGGGQNFTLDGFAMPGDLPIDLWSVNSYPCTFLRKQDRSGWIPLTRPDVEDGDTDLIVLVSNSFLPPEYQYGKRQLCCGLFEHNCRGKTFYARILYIGDWTEEQKKRKATFYLKKDTIFYDSFPEYIPIETAESDNEENFTEFEVGKDCQNWSSTWGELIEKYGDKPFGVRIFANDYLVVGNAFAIN